jgi:2Fe-2S ferredoxin
MPIITYVEACGTEHSVEVEEGFNLMEGATLNMVPGIEGVCGGMCACATCHCYIEDADAVQHNLAEAEQGELDMLEEALDRKANSRLSCQITASAELDGLRVYLPEAQLS